MPKIETIDYAPNQLYYDLGIKFGEDLHKVICRNISLMLVAMPPNDVMNIALSVIANMGIATSEAFKVNPESFIEITEAAVQHHKKHQK